MRGTLVRALSAAAFFALCSGAAHASTLTVTFSVTQLSGELGNVTSATLNIVSSTVADLSTFTGTLVSSSSNTDTGQLNNGGTDSTLVTVGAHGTTYDLVNSHVNANSFNPLVVTTITLVNGAVTSLSVSSAINGSAGGYQNSILDFTGSTTELVADGPYSTPDSDLFLPDPPATPLPSSIVLFGTGLSALGLLLLRSKRKNRAALAGA